MNDNTTPQTANPIEAQRALKIADSAYELALAFEIDSPEMFSAAGDELRAIEKRAKEIEELRLSLTHPLDESKKRIMDLFRAPAERLGEASGLIRKGMLSYQQAEREKAEKLRREAEEKARQERAEQERIRREAEAEQRRIREEQAAVDRKAREEAEVLRKAGDEAAARQAEIAATAQREQAEREAAEANARAEEATAQIELADIAPPQLPAVEAPKAAGISSRQNWKAEVTDLALLVRAAAAGIERGDTTFLAFLQADTKALGQAAKALKAQARIPGVRVYADESLAVRTAA